MAALLSEVDVLIPLPKAAEIDRADDLRTLVDAVGSRCSMRDLVEKLDGRLDTARVFELAEGAIGEVFDRSAPLPLDGERAARLDRFHLLSILAALGPSICDESARARLRAFFEAVPIAIRNGYSIVELPMQGEDRSVDFACSILAGHIGHVALSRAGSAGSLPKALLADPSWAAAAKFAERWGPGKVVTPEEMTDIFLEFDLSQTPTGTARPSLWFRIAAAFHEGDRFPAPGERAGHLDDVGRRIFSTFDMRGTWDRASRRLLECIRRLPADGRCHVDSIGALVARQGHIEDVRVFCACLNPADVLPYLRDVGWSGDLEPIAERIRDPLAPLQINLQLTIRGDTLLPELSVEFQPMVRGDSLSGGALEWMQSTESFHAELRRFVEHGWCTRERFEAIVRWAGTDVSPEVPGQRIVRLPNHFKLRVWSDGTLLDKMYLAVDFLPRIRSLEV